MLLLVAAGLWGCAAALSLQNNIYCADPDDGSLHSVNSTWSATQSCSNYTCRIRKKVLYVDKPKASIKQQEVSNPIVYDDSVRVNAGDKTFCFNENEVRAIADIIGKARKCDVDNILEMFKIAKELLADIDNLDSGFGPPNDPTLPDTDTITITTEKDQSIITDVVANSPVMESNVATDIHDESDTGNFYATATIYKPRYDTQKSVVHIHKSRSKPRMYGSLIKYPAYYGKTYKESEKPIYVPKLSYPKNVENPGFFYPWITIRPSTDQTYMPVENSPAPMLWDRAKSHNMKYSDQLQLNVHAGNILSPWRSMSDNNTPEHKPVRFKSEKIFSRRAANSQDLTSTTEAQIDFSQYEIYIEVTTCETDYAPAYYTVGDLSKPFPFCCPVKIEQNEDARPVSSVS